LSELAGSDWNDVSRIQARAGTAPVTYESGQVRRVKLRRACILGLRSALHLWADQSRLASSWAATFYQAHRDLGQSHACALRTLAHRWLKIIAAMLRTRTPYDPEKHLRNQQAHGSWVFTLLSSSTATAKPCE